MENPSCMWLTDEVFKVSVHPAYFPNPHISIVKCYLIKMYSIKENGQNGTNLYGKECKIMSIKGGI